MSTELPHRVARALANLAPEGPVLAAVSGGADSMALMHLLHRAGRLGAVATFDHHTRDGESARDADFVATAAAALGVPCHRGGARVSEEATRWGESFEMAARRLRYDFLFETARRAGIAILATGHHQDDQAETVLLRLLRGASPSGLGGIPPRREEQGIAIVRPLLEVSREDLRAWLATEGIPWREDRTNADADFLRNRVRHDLLNALARDYNPAVAEALTRLARLQRLDNALLDRLADGAARECENDDGVITRAAFRAMDEALRFRCVAAWVRRAGGTPVFDCVARAVDFLCAGDTGRQLDLGAGARLYLRGDHGEFLPADRPVADEPDVVLPVPGVARGFGNHYEARIVPGPPPANPRALCGPQHQLFDGDALPGPFVIRRWRAGDRMAPLGMAGTRKVQDILTDRGLNPDQRRRQFVIESGDAIVWLPGYTVARHAAITAATRRVVALSIRAEAPEEEQE